MKHRRTTRTLAPPKVSLLGLLLLLGLVSCGTTPSGEQEGAPSGSFVHVSAPWTRDFLTPAMLVADEISIEGPTGLRDHMVVRQDTVNTVYAAKTLPRGFLQETVARSERGYVEIHAHLDALQMVAFRRIVWLERPGDGPVIVRATGDALWKLADGSDEKSGPEVELRGSGPR